MILMPSICFIGSTDFSMIAGSDWIKASLTCSPI